MKGKIVVFCSASNTIKPEYNSVAREFVRSAVSRGYGIVSGGTIKGTMGEIADEVNLCGGYHLGVIPRFMSQYVYPQMSETVYTDTMAERKTLLREGTLAVIALPGGIGTLDELIETFALIHLKQYHGKIFVLNYNGFYNPLKALLDHYVAEGMLCPETMDKLVFAQTTEEILAKLDE
jgi:uncharacterized protein (TIGR00730 family)